MSQDYAGKKGQPVSSPLSRSGTVWAKPLSARNSSAALLMGGGPGLQPDCTTNSTVFFADLGYTAATKCTVRDLVARSDLGMFTGAYTAQLHKDESMLVKITPCPTCWP